MAFLEVVGELFGFSDNKGWELVPQDAAFGTTIKGQFLAESLSQSIGSNLGETTTVNKDKPNFQWLNGTAEVVTFRTRIYANDSFKNVQQQIQLLKSAARRNAELKRAPIFLFTAGTEIAFKCFVRGIEIDYDELRSDGSQRGIQARLTLQVIEEIDQGSAETSLASQIKFAAGVVAAAAGIANQLGRVVNIPGGSLHTLDRTRKAKSGDTFESIAADEYGNALFGDILRRVQPEKVNLKPNDNVLLVEPTEIVTIQVTQQAIALQNTPENLALREEYLSLRNRTTRIFV